MKSKYKHPSVAVNNQAGCKSIVPAIFLSIRPPKAVIATNDAYKIKKGKEKISNV